MAKNDERLREHVRLAMAKQRFRTRDDLAKAAEISVATVGNVLAGKGAESRQAVEYALGWPAGTIRAILEGDEPGLLPSVKQAAEGTSVGDGDEDADAVRHQRPPGLTDEQWEQLQRENEDHWRYLINKYGADNT